MHLARRFGGPSVLVAVALLLTAAASSPGCGRNGNPFSAGGAGGNGGAAATGSGGHGFAAGVGGSFVSASSSGTGGGGPSACDPPCAAMETCSHQICVPAATCATDEDCVDDTYCETGQCVPWAGKMPPYDAACANVIVAGILSPKVRCEFAVAPMGDPFPTLVDVQATPIVVNFNKPASSGPPSIIAPFTATVLNNYTEDLGVLRVLRGTDCTLEANLGGVDLDGDGVVDWVVSPSTPATGDLDGDGVADIVAYGADGSTLAFARKAGKWGLLWKSPYTAGQLDPPCTPDHRCKNGWSGPSIHDLDDDGKPEVIREGSVIGHDGKVLSGPPPGYLTYSQGLFSVLANLDQDPAIELSNGQFVWEWTNGAWVQEPSFPGATPSAPGQIAVADFGAYGQGLPANSPELVVVRDDDVMIYAMNGELAQPPVPVPGAGGGGPPTVSDFDGDGLPEVGVAGQAFYTVYDIDCGPNPRPGGKCNLGPCDFSGGTCPAGGYILWSRHSQDISSDVTGSSVFDFEADGTSEVVYADECFVRVYNGKTGDVLFSQYRSSCTWYENPVVADVDGNLRADLVTPSNKACSLTGDGIECKMLDANGVDTQFPGLRCQTGADCVSGTCDAGFCRCVTGADCCGAKDEATCLDEGYKCAQPPAGTPGAGGLTCRAAHPHGLSGIRVYSDVNDKWVRSRTIWNQHPYAVTHVNEDGTVPKTSAWANNWQDPKLNNFRQNVPGVQNALLTGDATAGPAKDYACSANGVTLSAPVCNRGAADIGPGLSVGFYVGANKVCGATTSAAIAPGTCEAVSCVWSAPPTSAGSEVDVTVVPNDDGAYAECKRKNDPGTIAAVFCKPAG